MRTLLYRVETSEITPSRILLLTAVPIRPRDRIHYKPGQYAMIAYELSKKYQKFHSFSIVSNPTDDYILFGIKISGPFTQSLATLSPGSLIAVRGPYGSFILRAQDTRDSVFIAAGIGITPFMSMLTYAHATNQPQHIGLLYSVRSSRDIPFINTINYISKTNPRIHALISVTGSEETIPSGFIKGRISQEMIESMIPRSVHTTRFYICGPSAFIHSVEDILAHLSVRQKYIYTEDFVPSVRVLWKQPISFAVGTGALVASVLVFSVATNAHDVSAFADKSLNRLNTIFTATDINATFNKQRQRFLSQGYEAYTVPQVQTVLVPKQTTQKVIVTENMAVTNQVSQTVEQPKQQAPIVVQNPPRVTSPPPQPIPAAPVSNNPAPVQPTPQPVAPTPVVVQPPPAVTPTPPPPRTAVS